MLIISQLFLASGAEGQETDAVEQSATFEWPEDVLKILDSPIDMNQTSFNPTVEYENMLPSTNMNTTNSSDATLGRLDNCDILMAAAHSVGLDFTETYTPHQDGEKIRKMARAYVSHITKVSTDRYTCDHGLDTCMILAFINQYDMNRFGL